MLNQDPVSNADSNVVHLPSRNFETDSSDVARRYRHRPNQDVLGMTRNERDCFSAIAHRHRVVCLLDMETTNNDRVIPKLFLIRFEKVRFEGRKLIVEEVLYNRSDGDGDPRLVIPLSNVLGYGDLWIEWPEETPEWLTFLGDDVISVLKGAIAGAIGRGARA